jgi:colicin import membrane protein
MNEQMARELASSPKPEAVRPAAPAPSAPVVNNAYAGRIRAKILGKIPPFPEIPGNPEAIFDVIQIPSGEVIDVTPRKRSGFPAYDEAVERAIRGSSPLPLPVGAQEQFQRQLELKFRPKDPL